MSGEADPNALVSLVKAETEVDARALCAHLGAHGVEAVIQGEHHRSMLGVLGAYIEPALLVKASELEQARRLVEEYRAAARAEEDPELEAELAREAEGAAVEAEDLGIKPRPQEALRRSPKRAGVAILLALVPGLGCGHFYAGATFRGALLLLAELAGLALGAAGEPAGAILLGGAMLVDLIGAPLVVVARK